MDNNGNKLDEPNTKLWMQYDGDGSRQKMFHKKDSEITVVDLWNTWVKSEVHNWTLDNTLDWLINSVDLPQYQARKCFIENKTLVANNFPVCKGPLHRAPC